MAFSGFHMNVHIDKPTHTFTHTQIYVVSQFWEYGVGKPILRIWGGKKCKNRRQKNGPQIRRNLQEQTKRFFLDLRDLFKLWFLALNIHDLFITPNIFAFAGFLTGWHAYSAIPCLHI